MGCNPMKKSCCCCSDGHVEKKMLPNPDPSNYVIDFSLHMGRYMIVKINYPDCKNYEGNKILVFRDVTMEDLRKQKIIDPHFCDNDDLCSPIARFVPSDEGKEMAITFIDALIEKEK